MITCNEKGRLSGGFLFVAFAQVPVFSTDNLSM